MLSAGARGLRARVLISGLLLGLGLSTSCADEEGGISEAAACDVYSDKLVECLSDDPTNDDNIKSVTTTQCKDELARYAELNPDNDECTQAARRYLQCYAIEPSCTELAVAIQTQDFTGICTSEYFDIAEFCEYLPAV